MENFPSNSNEARKLRPVEPDEKFTPKVIEGEVIRRKPPLGKRVRAMFLGDNDRVMESIIGDVMIPAFKDLIVDSITQGMERAFFGEARSRSSRRSSVTNNSGYTPYNRYSSQTRSANDRPPSGSRRRPSNEFYDIILADRFEAQKVINELRGIIRKYEIVTVRELYEMIGEEFHPSDEKFGWVDLDTATVRRVANSGYMLVLPTPEAIDS